MQAGYSRQALAAHRDETATRFWRAYQSGDGPSPHIPARFGTVRAVCFAGYTDTLPLAKRTRKAQLPLDREKETHLSGLVRTEVAQT